MVGNQPWIWQPEPLHARFTRAARPLHHGAFEENYAPRFPNKNDSPAVPRLLRPIPLWVCVNSGADSTISQER
jgi:hypothetical protein